MFKKALNDAVKWSAKWYFGSFSTAVCTFFFFEKYLEFEFYRSLRYGVGVVILSFLIKLIITYIKLIDDLEKKVQEKNNQIDALNEKNKRKELITGYFYYGEVILNLKDTFSVFHQLRSKTGQLEDKEVVQALVVLCNNLKYVYEKRFSYKYSVCVKLLGPQIDWDNITHHTPVSTICRDENSYRSRSQPNTVIHNIFSNTCFVEIFNNIHNPDKSFYINNDLPEDKYYKNSSFNVYGELPESADSIEERRKHWTLPYKSEIVVPISPLNSTLDDRLKEFMGYLCVDCNEENAFHSKYDVGTLRGVADGVYDLVKTAFKK